MSTKRNDGSVEFRGELHISPCVHYFGGGGDDVALDGGTLEYLLRVDPSPCGMEELKRNDFDCQSCSGHFCQRCPASCGGYGYEGFKELRF